MHGCRPSNSRTWASPQRLYLDSLDLYSRSRQNGSNEYISHVSWNVSCGRCEKAEKKMLMFSKSWCLAANPSVYRYMYFACVCIWMWRSSCYDSDELYLQPDIYNRVGRLLIVRWATTILTKKKNKMEIFFDFLLFSHETNGFPICLPTTTLW